MSLNITNYKAPDYIEEMNNESWSLLQNLTSYLEKSYHVRNNDQGCSFYFTKTKYLFEAKLNSKRNLFEIVCITARNRINLLPNTEESKHQKIRHDAILLHTFREISQAGSNALIKFQGHLGDSNPDIAQPILKDLTETIKKTEACVRGLCVAWQT